MSKSKKIIKTFKNQRRQLIKLILILCIVILVNYRQWIYINYYYGLFYIDQDAFIKQELKNFSLSGGFKELRSECSCRQDQIINLTEKSNEYLVQIVDRTSQKTLKINRSYSISREQFQNNTTLTCDLYNALRRGSNQRVIAYSLYGTNAKYYKDLKDIVMIVKKRYPNWIIRVYHDSSILSDFKCEMECLTYLDERSGQHRQLDTVDFCDIEQLPYDLTNTYNASYMHGMSWRWLPIGDSFVDFVASRDTDAWISQRELDSVNVWLSSHTLFHVMRDNPQHNIPIVGGYWGFANSRDRHLADHLFKILTNKKIADFYNPGQRNLKGYDQYLLTDFFSTYSLRNSTTHDAYLCRWINGDPWPTKRPENNFCFVGCSECCDQPVYTEQNPISECPKKCRPKEHADWIYC